MNIYKTKFGNLTNIWEFTIKFKECSIEFFDNEESFHAYVEEILEEKFKWEFNSSLAYICDWLGSHISKKFKNMEILNIEVIKNYNIGYSDNYFIKDGLLCYDFERK